MTENYTRRSTDSAMNRIETHEQVCAVRYESIDARLKRLETVGLSTAGAIILLLLNIVYQLSTKG